MGVEVEVTVTPAHEESDGEEDDEDATAVSAPCALGEVALGEQDRNAEEHERDAVPDSPPGAERCGRSRSFLAPRRDERRHRGDVVRVGRVAQPEQDADEEHDRHRRAFGEPAIQSSSPNMPLVRANAGSVRTVSRARRERSR